MVTLTDKPPQDPLKHIDINYFHVEEFFGCCAFSTLFDFPASSNKDALQVLDRRIHRVDIGEIDTGSGGIFCTLNEYQLGEWEKPLTDRGFARVVSDVENPNTGNKVYAFFLDLQNSYVEPEEDIW